MARRTRLQRPPRTANPELDQWLNRIYSEINNLPNFSIVSVGDVNSSHTGQAGDLVIDVSGGEGHLWLKHDDGSATTVWEPIATSGYGILYSEEENAAVLTVTTSDYSTVPAIYMQELSGAISATTGDEGYFTINSEGTYHLTFNSSFTADTNTVWDFDLFHNASVTSFGFQRGIGASSLPGSGSFDAICFANSGDTFDVRAEHDNVATKAATILYSQFFIDKRL